MRPNFLHTVAGKLEFSEDLNFGAFIYLSGF